MCIPPGYHPKYLEYLIIQAILGNISQKTCVLLNWHILRKVYTLNIVGNSNLKINLKKEYE